MPPSTATPSVAPIIRAVLTTPAAAPACAFGAAETATESNGPVLKPKPTPIDKKANSIKTMSAVRESVERASSPSPISANPHAMIRRAPDRLQEQGHQEQHRVHAERHACRCDRSGRERARAKDRQRQQGVLRAYFHDGEANKRAGSDYQAADRSEIAPPPMRTLGEGNRQRSQH